MMKQTSSLLLILVSPLCIVPSASAFSRWPSSFTGRASCVASRAELTTELSCPPTRTELRKGHGMSMPPFLKKLGLKKPGGDKEEEEQTAGGVATLEKPAADSDDVDAKAVAAIDEECIVPEEEEELTETQKLLKQVKDSGTAGVISYALWELAFWFISIPVCSFGFYKVTGHWPDFRDTEDLEKLSAEAFAFVNFARFAVPLRIGLALSTTPWINENVVEKFLKKDEPPVCEE